MMYDFLVIVDLNGTLIDTEVAFFKAYKDIFAKYHIPFTIEDFTNHWSTQGKKLKEYLEKIGRNDLFSKEKEMLDKKDTIFQTTLHDRVIFMSHVKETLQMLKNAGISLGLDSSSSKENIEKMLALFGLRTIFDGISSGDMEIDKKKYGDKKKKSSRMKALAHKLRFPYEKCIVIGDAEKDIKGAKEAGMKSIAVPNQYTRSSDFSESDIVVKSFADITPKKLLSLFS